MPNELNIPSILNDNVNAFPVSAINISENLHTDRPFGLLGVPRYTSARTLFVNTRWEP